MHRTMNTLVYYKRRKPILCCSTVPFHERGWTSSPSLPFLPCSCGLLQLAPCQLRCSPAASQGWFNSLTQRKTNPAKKWVLSAGSVKRVRSRKGKEGAVLQRKKSFMSSLSFYDVLYEDIEVCWLLAPYLKLLASYVLDYSLYLKFSC